MPTEGISREYLRDTRVVSKEHLMECIYLKKSEGIPEEYLRNT